MLCAHREYTCKSMTVDAFPRSKANEENSCDRSDKLHLPGMVLVPNLAMNNRPKLHIPNGYNTTKLSSASHPTSSRSRIHVDPWSPSAVKLSFFFGNDPDPDPRGNLLEPRGHGLSQSVTDLRYRSISCERAVPVFVSKPRPDDKYLSEDEEEYVTLDYNYVPETTKHESWAIPGSNNHTGIKCDPWTVPRVNHKQDFKGEHHGVVPRCNNNLDTKYELWTVPRTNHHSGDGEIRNQNLNVNVEQRSVSRTLRYPDFKCEHRIVPGNNNQPNVNCDSSAVPINNHYQDLMCEFRTVPRINHITDAGSEHRAVPKTCVKSPRGSFNPGFVPRDSFESSVLHVRENTPPVYSRHLSMENGRQTVSQRREWKNSSLQRVSESKVQTIATFTPVKNVDSSSGTLTPKHRKRSQSLPDLQLDVEGSSCNFSDDEDGDDFGFLSYPFLPSYFATAAMQKAKSPLPGRKILPKRWRSKTKTLSNTVPSSLWSPESSCVWCSVSGRKVVLKPVSLLQLIDAERIALQKLALSKLQTMELGVPVLIPKENGNSRSKRHTILLKRRSKSANIGGLLDALADKTREKEQKDAGLVFGIPLSKCISNDHKLKKVHSTSTTTLKARCESADILLSPRPRKSSSSSQSSADNTPHNGGVPTTNPAYRRTASSDSLSESESSRNTSSSLIDALSLSDSRQSSSHAGLMYATGKPQVPEVVQVCFKHLEIYGLHVLGIFRVGAAKKRVKQLRDDFDSGKEAPLDDSHQPHDVGALLKEYFRDLPEPLLTRDLYQAFIATRKIKDRHKQLTAMRLLVSLLPLPSRDTFWALMKFLYKVAQHSTDFTESNGNILPGNKMDSHNLATLFGPNILNKTKMSAEKEFLVESTEQAEQSKEVIEVVKDMIDNHYEIFEVTPQLHDEVIRVLMVTNPEIADKVLKKLSNDSVIDPDPDTSSSVFDDSDSPSLPHSPTSDADLMSQSRRLQLGHQPVRITKSADPRTKPIIQIEDDRRTFSSSEEKRYPTISIERTPSPKQSRSPFSYRKPKLKSPRDSSSPEILLRPQHDPRDRPYSEGFSHCLAIPQPSYMRENSSSSISSYLSSPNSPVGSESSVQWASHSPSSSPNPLKRSSSQSRPLNLQMADPQTDIKSPVGSAEWQRERWRHWELIAAEKATDTYEQETLV